MVCDGRLGPNVVKTLKFIIKFYSKSMYVCTVCVYKSDNIQADI